MSAKFRPHMGLMLSTVVSLAACGGSAQFGGAGLRAPTPDPSQSSDAATDGLDHLEKASGDAGAVVSEPMSGSVPLPEEIPTQVEVPSLQKSETFTTKATKGAVDLVWAIDNSGSMAEEAAQVRSNFARFIATTETRTDLRIALISKRGTAGTYVEMPGAGLSPSRVQLDVFVHSTNALAAAAMAGCPAPSTALLAGEEDFLAAEVEIDRHVTDSLNNVRKVGQVCGVALPAPHFVEDYDSIKAARGALQTFFRKEARRVYVAVTDDDAVGVNESNFHSMVARSGSAETPHVFSFRGQTSRTGCSITMRGLAYEALAAATKGGVFDICESDWSANFSRLAEQVYDISQEGFPLANKAGVRVLAVKLDGRTLSNAEFSEREGVVTLKPGIITAGGQTVEISYSYTP